jgi:NodT family efflux transporter outer membrane factor (OMF) lipoprotein
MPSRTSLNLRPGGPPLARPRTTCSLARLAALAVVAAVTTGCTDLRQYLRNGFEVGPNYARPPVPLEQDWIDAADVRVRHETDDLSAWWKVFNDPVLDALACAASRQNLSLRVAAFRVLEARYQLAIATGQLFPQTQQVVGDYTRNATSVETANFARLATGGAGMGGTGFKRWFGQWDLGFNLSWELDFWGRLRRAIESDIALLDASVENYDNTLVTLLGDIGTQYTQYRTLEQRIKYAQDNVRLQRETLDIVEARFKAGTTTELDVAQAKSTLEQTQSQIPEFEIQLRQTANQLCILLGIPPEDLRSRLGTAAIPAAPTEVAAGIPADLVRRRPDVRAAERQAAAQSAQIGMADAQFYPLIFVNGTFGWSAENFSNLWRPEAFRGTFGPSFQWNILNYGRILNNVRFQDARFQELIATYQNTVLTAQQDVENGLVTFLRAQERAKYLAASVADAENAVRIALAQYKAGTIDFTRVTQVEQNLVLVQDLLAQARGEVATGLIQVYRALGGGWQIRCTGCDPGAMAGRGGGCPTDPANAPSPSPTPAPGQPAAQATMTSFRQEAQPQPSEFATQREEP